MKIQKQTGFTLTELLIVMVILGMLYSLVTTSLQQKADSSRITTAKAQMQMIGTGLDAFRLDTGMYPEKMSELLTSQKHNWDGPYMKNEVPADPWGNEYQYKRAESGKSFSLTSNGEDGKPSQDDISI